MKILNPFMLQLKEIMQGSFPSWTWQKSPGMIEDHIPVFTFHGVKADPFEAQLRFLKQNNYRTVTCDDLVAFIRGERTFNDQEVLLTFDDGQSSVWTVAYPLLKKYGFIATVFAVPSIMTDVQSPRKTLEDVWNGLIVPKALEADPPSPLSWREIRIMHDEGIVDFQSHSLTHQRVSAGSEIVDFVSPEAIESHYFKFTLPWTSELHSFNHFYKLLGVPIYAGAPSLCGAKRYIEDRAIQKSCMDLVRECTPDDFFSQAGWKQLLMTHARYFRKENPYPDVFESDSEQKIRITDEVLRAREILNDKLPGAEIHHLAYPWGAGSDLAVECSKEAGYISNFWSTLPKRSKNNKGADPFHLVRLKHDFIWRLPGEGRQTLKKIFITKFVRRKKGETEY